MIALQTRRFHEPKAERIIKIDPRVIKLLMIENSEFGLPPRARSTRLETTRPPAQPAPQHAVTSSVDHNGEACIDASNGDS
jgi:hypothetical protein